ncbi:MAG: LysE family transporter [Chloroflexi bacterium]|nr:LysE family transporter [Chloroflexota bacterium]
MIAFLLEAFMISLSGVMAPGPLSAVVVGKGSRSPHAGAWVAFGHGAFEIPLMVAIFYGLGTLLQRPGVDTAIALIGGLFLLYMGVGMLRHLRSARVVAADDQRSPLLAGILLTAGNPYFLLWWATVGAALIGRAMQFGFLGFAALAIVHWSCDLAWCYLLSSVSYKGGTLLGRRFQMAILGLSGLFLLFFGARFLLAGVQSLMA